MVSPQEAPAPSARLSAMTLYAKIQTRLKWTWFIVSLAMVNNAGTAFNWEERSTTLPPLVRHDFPCAIIIPTSAAARLGASLIPSPILEACQDEHSRFEPIIGGGLTMATFSPCFCKFLMICNLASGRALVATTEIPSSEETRRASACTSPVAYVQMISRLISVWASPVKPRERGLIPDLPWLYSIPASGAFESPLLRRT